VRGPALALHTVPRFGELSLLTTAARGPPEECGHSPSLPNSLAAWDSRLIVLTEARNQRRPDTCKNNGCGEFVISDGQPL